MVLGKRSVGDRIGAILGGSDTKVELLGYGTYEGEGVPYTAVGIIAEGLIKYKLKNPKLQLDNGKIVWGCECWWGSEAAIKRQVEEAREKGIKIVEVDIDEVRTLYAKTE